jgi:hypothetical protein
MEVELNRHFDGRNDLGRSAVGSGGTDARPRGPSARDREGRFCEEAVLMELRLSAAAAHVLRAAVLLVERRL